MKNNSLACHGPEKPKGKLGLSGYTSVPSIVKDHRVWGLVRERLLADEMPPAEAKRQPMPDGRRAVVEWIGALLDREAQRNAGDPGTAPPRRLSNAEFDYTIRDLTGVDIRPTKEFPVDPANEAGFDNSSESLAASPALLKKQLAAAGGSPTTSCSKPSGFEFASRARGRPRRTATTIACTGSSTFTNGIRSTTPVYFLAAWRFQNRVALGKPIRAHEWNSRLKRALIVPLSRRRS